jgi:hypothetical protein
VQGRNYSQTDSKKLKEHYNNALLEIGMFCNTFAALCIESQLDISHTLCFPKKLEKWEDGFDFLDQEPILLMTAGKALAYHRDQHGKDALFDLRPNYDRIVNFVK